MRIPLSVYVFLSGMLATFVLSVYVEACTPTTLETKAEDSLAILVKDAVCVAENLSLSDAEIVNRCAPAPSETNAAPRTLSIEKYVYFCRHPDELDAGTGKDAAGE